MIEERPIFVRGMSRSGGTLMVTILDAHTDVAMSYELYPNLLEIPDGGQEILRGLAERIRSAKTFKRALGYVKNKGLKTFLARCPRGGMDHRVFSDVLTQHIEAGKTFKSAEERLQFVARCCNTKMRKLGKSRWGLKCTSRYTDYCRLWPNAYFINMLRDGRDVLASQLHTGSFQHTPAEVGESWARNHRQFRQLVNDGDVLAYQVRYESLVTDPVGEVQRLTDFLGLSFEPGLLDYHARDLTIYSTSHLSMSRISLPVDAARVGRWKSELTPTQIAEFLRGANGALHEFGYCE